MYKRLEELPNESDAARVLRIAGNICFHECTLLDDEIALARQEGRVEPPGARVAEKALYSCGVGIEALRHRTLEEERTRARKGETASWVSVAHRPLIDTDANVVVRLAADDNGVSRKAFGRWCARDRRFVIDDDDNSYRIAYYMLLPADPEPGLQDECD
jgi:hypothetical protein